MLEQLAGVFHRVGFDVDHPRRQATDLHRRTEVFDLLAAAGRQQHIHRVRRALGGAQDLEIQIHFFDGIGNVLIGLDLDLLFHVLQAQAVRHGNHLGDCRGAGHCSRRVLGAGAGSGDRAQDRLADDFDLDYLLVCHCVGRQCFGSIGLNVITFAPLAKLQQLHRTGTNIQSQQALAAPSEQRLHDPHTRSAAPLFD